MENNEIGPRYQSLYDRFNCVPEIRLNAPLLAHYTSISALESILQSNRMWFSNPLYMNDWEEMRFGMLEGARIFKDPRNLEKAGGTPERALRLDGSFDDIFRQFDTEGAFDTYVFCLSEHRKDNTDGLLSMWRGYGGFGKGAAIVFDTSKLRFDSPEPTLDIAKVVYASADERVMELRKILDEWATVTAQLEVTDDQLFFCAFQAFAVIRKFALTRKHVGFSEEQEWRVIYLPDYDVHGKLKKFLDYHIGPNGIEPKLKMEAESEDGIKLNDIIDRILLGPSVSTRLSYQGICRMLERINRKELCTKLFASTIPLRAT